MLVSLAGCAAKVEQPTSASQPHKPSPSSTGVTSLSGRDLEIAEGNCHAFALAAKAFLHANALTIPEEMRAERAAIRAPEQFRPIPTYPRLNTAFARSVAAHRAVLYKEVHRTPKTRVTKELYEVFAAANEVSARCRALPHKIF